MKSFGPIFLMLIAMSGGMCARAGQPTDQLRASTDRILALLGNPDIKTDAQKAERRQLIRKELDHRIDWTSVARSSLGRYWAKLTPAQQTEFVSLFSRLLEETSLDKFETNYRELEKIDYLGEKIIDDYASIKTQATTKDQIVHPVEFRLQRSGAEWRVYDVLLEGVSLVKNYRDQFDEILRKSSYETLVSDLRAKLPQSSP